MPENNDYSIYAYDLYVHLRDRTPEFEQLAAVQAGGGTGSVTARREGGTAPALPAYGEYVSGNYFLNVRTESFEGKAAFSFGRCA